MIDYFVSVLSLLLKLKSLTKHAEKQWPKQCSKMLRNLATSKAALLDATLNSIFKTYVSGRCSSQQPHPVYAKTSLQNTMSDELLQNSSLVVIRERTISVAVLFQSAAGRLLRHQSWPAAEPVEKTPKEAVTISSRQSWHLMIRPEASVCQLLDPAPFLAFVSWCTSVFYGFSLFLWTC